MYFTDVFDALVVPFKECCWVSAQQINDAGVCYQCPELFEAHSLREILTLAHTGGDILYRCRHEQAAFSGLISPPHP